MTRRRFSATEWAERVRAWRASGEAAEDYAAPRGWNPRTLLWWSRQSPQSPGRSSGDGPVAAGGFVQLVERRGAPPAAVGGPQDGALEVVLGRSLAVRVLPGANLELLRAVVQALEVR